MTSKLRKRYWNWKAKRREITLYVTNGVNPQKEIKMNPGPWGGPGDTMTFKTPVMLEFAEPRKILVTYVD